MKTIAMSSVRSSVRSSFVLRAVWDKQPTKDATDTLPHLSPALHTLHRPLNPIPKSNPRPTIPSPSRSPPLLATNPLVLPRRPQNRHLRRIRPTSQFHPFPAHTIRNPQNRRETHQRRRVVQGPLHCAAQRGRHAVYHFRGERGEEGGDLSGGGYVAGLCWGVWGEGDCSWGYCGCEAEGGGG